MNIPNNFVEIIFDRYIKTVYKGQHVAPIQMRELKKCFFAAFWSSINEVASISEALPEEHVLKILDSIDRECKRHAQMVIDDWYAKHGKEKGLAA